MRRNMRLVRTLPINEGSRNGGFPIMLGASASDLHMLACVTGYLVEATIAGKWPAGCGNWRAHPVGGHSRRELPISPVPQSRRRIISTTGHAREGLNKGLAQG